MANRIRTLNFLPEIFQTTTNSQFLGATLDQIVDQPNTQKIQGYIGSKFGYAINAKDHYVTEPTKTREDYQLEPAVVFKKENDVVAKDFISYPGIVDSLKLEGGITNDNSRLFESQIYSWDSFTNLDPLVNFNQYYWIPEGPERVIVTNDPVSRLEDYVVQDFSTYYNISPVGTTDTTVDPVITLLRGGTYTFSVNQNSKFWIQGVPGISGADPTQPNLSTRDIYGVTNNGVEQGVITFQVPYRDEQNEFILPGNNTVDVVSDIPFFELNGKPVNDFDGIDGVTSLDGLTVLFYNTGYPSEFGFVHNFYDLETTAYDVNNNLTPQVTVAVTATTSGTNLVTCNSTTNLKVGQSITFGGTSFGGIDLYNTSSPSSYFPNTMIEGKLYYIVDLGSTDWIAAGLAASSEFTGYISGTVLFVQDTTKGSIEVGQTLVGTGVTEGTTVVDILSNAQFNGFISNGEGGLGTVLSVTEMYYGTLAVGTVISASNVPEGTYITGIIEGEGGVGLYTVSEGTLINPTILTGTAPEGYTAYAVSNYQDVESTTINGYDISVGRMFTATGPVDGTGLVSDYAPAIYYISSIVNGTQFTISTEIVAATPVAEIQLGQTYIISYLGNTDFTRMGASANEIGVVFVATQQGAGTGVVTEVIAASDTVYQKEYIITSLGDTDFTLIGASSNEVGLSFTATGPGTGTGTVLPANIVELTNGSGSMIGYASQGLYEQGYYSDVNQNFYKITYIGEPGSQVINLSPAGLIPNNQKVTAKYGDHYINRSFFKDSLGYVNIIPYISAILDVLYYQDGTTPNKFGKIKIIESNLINQIDINEDILGKKNYTSTNGVEFINGLKVTFQGDIYPQSYLNNEYFVEGAGEAIELIPVTDLIAPEPFTGSILIPWDSAGFGVTNYEGNSYIPIYKDYITIARNSVNKNAWSRSNRWFHVSVIEATATYNNDPSLLSLYSSEDSKAKRPIIEFYPNLKLFDSGIVGKSPIDFMDFRTKDAFSLVSGQQKYYPDVEVYTTYTASIQATNYSPARAATQTASNGYVTCFSTEGFKKNDTVKFDGVILNPLFGGLKGNVTYYIVEVIDDVTFTMSETLNGPVVTLQDASSIGPEGTFFSWSPKSTRVTVKTSDITGPLKVAQYIVDTTNLLPKNSYVSAIDVVADMTVITVSWTTDAGYFGSGTGAGLVLSSPIIDNFGLFDGARIVFAAEENENVRGKVYVSRFTQLSPNAPLTITLSEAADGQVIPLEQLVAFRGFNYQGKDFFYDGVNWIEGQQKTTVNQPPLFDIFDNNGVSFGDKAVYAGSSFAGSKLFSYGVGSGINDTVLGFPLRYSAINNVNDISFDVNMNSDTFTYVENFNPITQEIRTGYVHNYSSYTDYNRMIGWQTAVSPSVQYQLFSFDFDPSLNQPIFTCDIAPNLETNWPTVLVYNNNNLLIKGEYTLTTTDVSTTVTLTTSPIEATVIQVLILSDQVSNKAYYTTPINLNNNPLNENLSTVAVGDLRLQYQSICTNNPNISGTVFGNNNFRNLGNLVPWANQIIQNSASLVLPGAFLRKQNHNLFKALAFNNIEYIKYKTLLINTANSVIIQQTFNPSEMLDQVLEVITSSKTNEQSFFWSDMVPSKAAFISNTYTFSNSLDTSVYPLSRTYDFTKASYYGVLVYLIRKVQGTSITTQMVKDVDYSVSSTTPSLTITLDLLPGDQVIIKEFNQTYGSYAPNTPTKLGLYPKFVPEIVQDTDYSTPTWFIRGHDGSYNKLYGDYNPNLGVLIDFRDQVLFEYEKRVYNNLKVDAVIPVQPYDILPGFFRNTEYSLEQFLEMYSSTFLDWIGQNRVDYKTQVYNQSNQLTYNYFETSNKLNKEPIIQGFWRGIYSYYYDTFTPNTTPWEMIGLSDKPSWWEGRYGAAPYTSDNVILWADMSAGLNWNNGEPYVVEWAVRPDLLKILPVDSAGNLVSPFVSIVGNYTLGTFQRDWKIGDIAPTELSYRRSSSWPFDLMRLLALTKPAQFFNLAVDIDTYKYSTEFDQYLVNNRSHLVMSDIDVYGNGTPVTSYINWIVDYEKQIGVDATMNIKSMLNSLDVRLAYRLAGFSDKSLLKFFVEKGTPNNRNASLLIPDESYQVLLYDNQPFDTIVYSGMIIQLTPEGHYAVFGNSQYKPVFVALEPLNNGNFSNITVENITVKIPVDFSTTEKIIPYGTVFHTIQEVATFIASVGARFIAQGMTFDYMENELEVNWNQMVAEFVYYAQSGWESGSILTLNPAAKSLKIDKDGYIVQPLTLQSINFVLNENLYPIMMQDLNVVRENTMFNVMPLNQGDSIGYGQFNISNFEHGIVFNNLTLFDDVVYNLVTGIRQLRIAVTGWKTAEWNGTITASGFILNQDNIQEWNKEAKYTKGVIVKYKNKYWTALKVIQPGNSFNEQDWKATDYDQVQKGLLPNPSTRSYESTLYYNTNTANLENDGDLLGFSLIGYRPREYMTMADLSDITQVNVYKNLIKEKGTPSAAKIFSGVKLPQGEINYDLYENWAIKAAEFGGVLNTNYIQIGLNQKYLTGNPSTVGLVCGGDSYNCSVQQNVPLNAVFNYGRPITSPNILSTISSSEPSKLFPDAGYVNFNDVKMSSYYYNNIDTAVNEQGSVVPLTELLVRDYVWLANFKEQWQVVTPKSLGEVVYAKNNMNSTVTVMFAEPHNLTQYQPFAIVNFDSELDGYYVANVIPTPNTVIVNATINPTVKTITGLGVAMQFQSQRVATPADINSLPLLDSEFIKNTVWVDTDNDGSWAVYRKSINYNLEYEITKVGSSKFGTAVAHSTELGYLISDAAESTVYRYTYNALTGTYNLEQTISTEDVAFGSAIEHQGDMVAIADSDSGVVYIYQLLDDGVINELVLNQILGPITGGADSLAMSDDKNWLYVGVTQTARVAAYRKSIEIDFATNIVPDYLYTIVTVGDTDYTLLGAKNNEVGTTFKSTSNGFGTGTVSVISYVPAFQYNTGLPNSYEYGYSIDTNYDGSVVVVGAPGQPYDSNTSEWGKVYVYNRMVQKMEASFTNVPNVQPEIQALAWTPTVHTPVHASSVDSESYIRTIGSMSGITAGVPVIFKGGSNVGGDYDFKDTGLAEYTVYYISEIDNTPGDGYDSRFRVRRSLMDPYYMVLNAATVVDFGVYAQLEHIDVSVNGKSVDETNYGIVESEFVYVGQLNAGDIVTMSSTHEFSDVISFRSSHEPRVGVRFGNSVSVNSYGNEILVGAPFELTADNVEGAVYRYTSGGDSYGIAIGVDDCQIAIVRKLMINGYLVYLPTGDAEATAKVINSAGITNVQASSADGKIILSLINFDLATPNQKLVVTAFDVATIQDLGIYAYTLTQRITCPHQGIPSQFGSVVKFNEFGSFVASAPAGARFEATTFDFIDDETSNDTVFDHNTTQFIDSYANAGAAYIFDYLNQYNESLDNPGKFVYAQGVNATNIDYGEQPMYGQALDFRDNKVIVGTPNFRVGVARGQVITFENTSNQNQNWSVYRKSAAVVDISKIGNVQIFDAISNNTLVNLDYIDPLQGKILGAARENIDYISNVDPAKYNKSTAVSSASWGTANVGQIWFDTSRTRFVNYHQNDVVYNTKYWGTVFPGSDIAVYTWVGSSVLPVNYQGPGVAYDVNSYVTQFVVNETGALVPMYYFWTRNTNVVFTKAGKTLADSIVASYIRSPINSGISYLAPILTNSFALYNTSSYIQSQSSVLSVNFSTGSIDSEGHQEYELIRENYADDFLSGLPTANTTNKEPESLYAKMIDSLAGTDLFGNPVPNPFLPIAARTGIMNRPKQSFFLNRLRALKNYMQYANEVLKSAPFVETLASTLIYKTSEFYDVPAYWEYVNWWAPGYDDSTKSALQVKYYADLLTLQVSYDTIVTVESNGIYALPETYIYKETGWERIGLTKGTIQIKSGIWDYADNSIGFGNNFYDTVPFDSYPSEETKYLVRALNEEIAESYPMFRNKGLILLFEYIQAEAIESQNYLTWLNKTSLVDVSHTIRELLPYQFYKSDNQEFLAGYINEVKPYHVVIKDFLFKYTGTDIFEGDISDFDLPAKYNTKYEQFITPQLVWKNADSAYQYLPSDPIWQDPSYTQWYNNYGLSITGQSEYRICSLTTYIALNTKFFFVDNALGFPTVGTVKIGGELIGYTQVDRVLNMISGLSRGVDNTTVSAHIPGSPVYIDLPGVLILDSGRGYTAPPRVIAYTDPVLYPAPRKAAILEPVMAGDAVVSITVVDPGDGYVTTPTIIIDPAFTIPFSSADVNTTYNTVRVYAPFLSTGDIIQYQSDIGSDPVTGLINGQWYYVNVLESTPLIVVALYSTYDDAINDLDRIKLRGDGAGTHVFNQGARAVAVTTSTPTRENILTLRYDRTSYKSDVIVWRPGEYYGAYYAGRYNNSLSVSSSSIKLKSTQPPIDGILASAQGVSFEIVSVRNDQTIEWSSFDRDIAYISQYVWQNDVETPSVFRLIPKAFSFEGVADVYQTNMIVTSASYGTLGVGTLIYNDVNPSISITKQISGTPGGIGVYEISQSMPTTTRLEIKGFEENTSGTTIGFYKGMPVQFRGPTGDSGVRDSEIYYIVDVLSAVEFTVSSGNNDISTPDFFNELIVGPSGLKMLVGEVTNKAVLNITYPGITTATETTASTNAVTIPLNLTGTGGTNNFYIGMPVFFTGHTFGGIIENDIYYVNGVLDNQHCTLSATNNPSIITMTATVAEDNTVVLTAYNTGYQLNEPVIFSTFVVNGERTNTFGNLNSNTVYYIINKIGIYKIQVSTAINGDPVTMTDVIGSGDVISQKNTFQLSDASGAMTININVPVSPGQINGQMFNLHKTSSQYPGYTGPFSELLQRTVTSTLGDVNRVTFTTYGGALDSMYVNMPLVFKSSIPGTPILADTTYYVTDLGTTSVIASGTTASVTGATFVGSISGLGLEITSVNSGYINVGATITGAGILSGTTIASQLSGTTGGVGLYTISTSHSNLNNILINAKVSVVRCTEIGATNRLYVGMPIIFNGTGLGNVNINTEYYVANIIDSIQFALSTALGGPVMTLLTTNETGRMFGKGEPWVTIAETAGGADLVLTDTIGTNTITQVPQETPMFDVSYIMGGYRVIITNPGAGFAVNNKITISGENFGGTTNNNLVLIVNAVDQIAYDPITEKLTSNGSITSVICSGDVPGSANQYFLKVISPTEVEVYENSMMTVPVSGIDFPYTGIYSETVYGFTSSGLGADVDEIMLNEADAEDYDNLKINDEVVFLGDLPEGCAIEAGRIYYIVYKQWANIKISEVPNGDPLVVWTDGYYVLPGLVTITRPGDYAVLPEPFYFNQSVVKYNNQVYVCVVSNNDDDFVVGKWEKLTSDDRQLNALDRVIGYYAPTDDMPGVDITQIITGTSYPNSVYLGNAFQPDEQFDVDTVLESTTFYPTQLDLVSIAPRKSNGVIAVLNTDVYSGVAISNGYQSGSEMAWEVIKIEDSNLNLTNITLSSTGDYLITSKNTTTDIIVGSSTLNDESDLKFTAVRTPAKVLNAVVESNGVAVAVGDIIVASVDGGQSWTKVYNVTPDARLNFELSSVTYASLSGFTGFVAVGKGQVFQVRHGVTYTIDTNALMYSPNGFDWTFVPPFSYHAFTSVSSNGQNLVAVGENNIIYYSTNGVNWISATETAILGTNGITNMISVLSVSNLSVNNKVQFFGEEFGNVQLFPLTGLKNNVYYYISEVDTGTSSIALSRAPNGVDPIVVATASSVNMAFLSKVIETVSEPTRFIDFNYVCYSSGSHRYVAIGNEGFIATSTNGASWTSQYQIEGDPKLNHCAEMTTSGTKYDVTVGDDNLVVVSTDAANWFIPATNFVRPEQTYSIKGDEFTAGYGPEELVPGVVSDNITMIVNTRPGTNWPATIYEHVGYKVISKEIIPETATQVVYSFDKLIQTPTQIRVSVVSRNPSNYYVLTEQSLYNTVDYTIDWVNKTITLNQPIETTQYLRINAYEVGDGDQLVKSNTDIDPIRYNSFTEWNEIYLNCYYSGSIFIGGGVVKPGSNPIEVVAIATEAETNTITCVSVKEFALNDPITFQGSLFGNITEDTTYYVKTISYASSTITVSTSFNINTGTAGSTFELSTATGEMFAVVQIGTGTTYADPMVYHNGTRLVPGLTGTITKMQSNNNTLTCNSTDGIIVGSTVVFSSNTFGNIQGGILDATEIQAGQTYRIDSIGDTDFTAIGAESNTVGTFFVATDVGSGTGTVTAVYFIKSIFDRNQFTITQTEGGEVMALYNATGGVQFITNDFSFGIQPNGVQATMIFAYPYDKRKDYIVYVVFGETEPEQYGGTLPECELLSPIGDGVIDTWDLHNYVSGSNALNAIVEVNGYRVAPSEYTISAVTNTITFNTPPEGLVAVTTYNLTDRQYLSTNTYTGKTVSSIVNVQNTLYPPIAQAFVSSITSNVIQCTAGSSTTGFIQGQMIQFYGISFGGVQTTGKVYIVESIIDSTHFTINAVLTNGTGSMTAVVGGQETVRVTTLGNNNLVTNDLIRIDGVMGSTQLNNNLYYVHVLNDTQFDIYSFDPENPNRNYVANATNNIVANVSAYTGGGFAWKTQSFILQTTVASETSSTSNRIAVSVDGINELVQGTPVVFMEDGVLVGATTLGGLIAGKTYYIKEIFVGSYEISVSETRDGAVVSLLDDTGTMSVTQWNQQNTDRLWVTVNGERIPSDSLRINTGNDISILVEISDSDEIVITSMMPSSTPDQQTYLLNVNQKNEPTVYRANFNSRTWLTHALGQNDEIMYVDNVQKLVSTVVQRAEIEAPVNGLYYIGLTADRNTFTGVTVYNNTRDALVPSTSYTIQIIDLIPTVVFSDGVVENDMVTITVSEGNLVYINGEQIKFNHVDTVTNTIFGLERGVNGTGFQVYFETYTQVYGLLPENKLPDAYYNDTWNPIPGTYNLSKGDPLQIATTAAANFFKPSPMRVK